MTELSICHYHQITPFKTYLSPQCVEEDKSNGILSYIADHKGKIGAGVGVVIGAAALKLYYASNNTTTLVRKPSNPDWVAEQIRHDINKGQGDYQFRQDIGRDTYMLGGQRFQDANTFFDTLRGLNYNQSQINAVGGFCHQGLLATLMLDASRPDAQSNVDDMNMPIVAGGDITQETVYTFAPTHGNEEIEVTLMHSKTRENHEDVEDDGTVNNHSAMNIRATFTIDGQGDVRVNQINLSTRI